MLFASPNDDLIKAAVKGDVAGATAAIESGADVNMKDKNGFTPLMIASNFGKIGIVKFLVGKGADVNIESANGDTALAIAEAKGHEEVVTFLKSLEKKREPAAEPAPKDKPAPEAKDKAEIPGFTVNRVIVGGRQCVAEITDAKSGMRGSYKPNDKLGDFTIASITPDRIVVADWRGKELSVAVSADKLYDREKEMYDLAVKGGTLESYEKYIIECPNAPEARRSEIHKLREAKWFEKLSKDGTSSDCQKFCDEYPQSASREKALELKKKYLAEEGARAEKIRETKNKFTAFAETHKDNKKILELREEIRSSTRKAGVYSLSVEVVDGVVKSDLKMSGGSSDQNPTDMYKAYSEGINKVLALCDSIIADFIGQNPGCEKYFSKNEMKKILVEQIN